MARNPITDFLVTKEAALADKRKQELDQLHTWRTNGRQPEHLAPLLQSYTPIIEQKVRQWKAPAVNEAAFRAELQKHVIKAFETYDPEKAALNTHVENHLKKALRFNNRHQNVGYIPEGQASQIGKLQRAENELAEEYGRKPTADELGNHLSMTPKQVTRLQTSLRRDIPASAFESDPHETELQRDEEVLGLLHYNLNQDERTVFNHIYGRDGHAKITSTNDLAKKLGKSPSQVSRLRSSIVDKYKQFK